MSLPAPGGPRMLWQTAGAPLLRGFGDAAHLPPFAAPLLPAHAQVLARALGRPLLGGNRVETLPDAGLVQQMVESARDHVNFDGDPAAAPRRARVLATHGHRAVALNLLRAGWLGRLTRRRGLALVIDGRVAFVGDRAAPLRIEGPAVAELQRRFMHRWREADRAALPAAHYFPALAPAGEQRIGLAADPAALERALLAAIEAAQQHVLLGRARRPALHQALAAATRRGVEVRLVPGAAVVIDGVWTLPEWSALVVLDAGFASAVERSLLG